MKKTVPLVSAAALLLVGASMGSAGAAAPLALPKLSNQTPLQLRLEGGDALSLPADRSSWKPRFEAFPGVEDRRMGREAKRASGALATFSNSVVVHGRRFNFTMVGSDISKPRARNTTVTVIFFPIELKFDDGTDLDPTAPLGSCAGGSTALARVAASPLIQSYNYGDGPRQWGEQFRRMEFASLVPINPGYSVRLNPLQGPKIILTIDPTAGHSESAPCGRLGMVDETILRPVIEKQILPQLKKYGVTPAVLPMFFLSNTVLYTHTTDNCCTLGYHSYVNAGGKQTYGIGEYDSNGSFDHVLDVSVLTHELAEWMDDPYGNNLTPPWGHIGQQEGCQNNLEVGDPLSGHVHNIPINGFTYHPQELAFFSWFFQQSPSLGYQGHYSSNGTLSGPAVPCQ